MSTLPFFLSVEGINGAGKTTLIRKLRPWISEVLQMPVVCVAEPYGRQDHQRSQFQIKLAELATESLHEMPTAAHRMTKYLLFMACRANIDVKQILLSGSPVIQDRYIDSMKVYDLCPHDLDKPCIDLVGQLFSWPTPDLTLWVDCQPDLAAERICNRKKPFRNWKLRTQEEISALLELDRARFKRLQEGAAERIRRIDANQSEYITFETAKAVLKNYFARPKITSSNYVIATDELSSNWLIRAWNWTKESVLSL